MNTNRFGSTFTLLLLGSAIMIGYMWDNSVTEYQQRVLLFVALMMLALCVLIAYVVAQPLPTEKRQPRVSRMSKAEYANASMLRHYPQSASFRVRMATAERRAHFH